MLHAYPPSQTRQLRSGLIELMTEGSFTHILHLTPNRRDMHAELLIGVFKTFCLEIDRWKFNRRKVATTPSGERYLAIAFPEKLATNPHLHGAADFAFCRKRGLRDPEIEHQVYCLWRKLTRGNGTAEVHPISTRGLRYIAKEMTTPDHRYVLSSEFHIDN
jgi:hypothetical protein